MSHDHELPPAERERLAQELLELHFGCHENPERLEARLAAEPALRALQRDVLAQAALLECAVLPEQPPLRLAAPRQRGPWLARLRSPAVRLATGAAAAALLVAGLLVAERIAAHRLTRHQHERLHVTVSAPRAVPAGAPWSFTVQCKDVAGGAVDAQVRWEALLADGSVLAANEIAARGGDAVVALPTDAALRVPDRVVVTARTSTDEVRHVLPLSTANAGPLVHVATDRPIYRPGEFVYVRAVVLDRVTRLPLRGTQPLRAQLLDPKGAPVVADADQVAPAGVGSFALPVPEGSAGGVHRVRVQSATGAFPDEDVEIVVRAFQPPQLRKEIVLDRISYAPGARGSAQVTVQRLAAGGGGAIGASARGALVIDGTEVWTEKRVLGALGEATFAFVVPKDVAKGAARFVATIDDGGIVETEVRPFVVPTGKVELAAFPEGGELVAGVENGLYLELTDPLGRSVDASGEIVDERGRHVARFRTQHQGRAKVELLPRAGSSYSVRLTGQKEPYALPAVREKGIALRLSGDDVAANAPLRLAVAGRGDGPWLLGVFCRGVLVGQTTLRAGDDGELRERAELALPAVASGVLRVTVFDRALQPVAERLVRRHAAQRLDVALRPQHAALSPGDQQQVAVTTTDETGAGRAAVVGVSVVDRGVLALGSEPQVGLVDQALLFADVERTENLGDFFVGASASAQNVDLLLGTRGWRRFVWRNDAAAQAAIAAKGDAAVGVLAREGFSQTPQVASNLDAARATGGALARDARAAKGALRDGAIAGALLLALLGVVEAIAWLAARLGSPRPWLAGSVTTAVALLFVALTLPQRLGAELAALAPGAVAAPAGRDFAAVAEGVIANLNPQSDAAAADPGNLLWDHVDASGLWLGQPGVIDLGGFGQGTGEFFAARHLVGGAGGGGGAFALGRPEALLFAQAEEAKRAAVGRGLELDGGEWDERLLANVPAWNRRDASLRAQLKAGYVTQWRQRQYAHRHVPSDERADFAPTVYWNTLVTTDERGEATVTFATSDAVTTWRVHADAHAPADIGRLGQADADFATRLPLHVDCKLPDEVSAGDRLLLPVAATVTDRAITEVALAASLGDGLRLDDGAPARIALQDGRGRALLPITVTGQPGTTTLRLDAAAGRFRDRIEHRLTIAPRGFPHRRSLGGVVAANEPSTATLTIPREHVAGSGRVTLKVFPSPLAALSEGLDGMLQEPHGCFEQTSSSNYPNTLVLTLLDASGDDVPTVAARARALLPKGYAKLVGYECKQQGYEWFGADPGHEALTAYGLLQFHDMAKVHDVDAAMVQRTRDWLLARRDGNGGFGRNPKALDRFGGSSPEVTNAYVTYALLQAGTPASTLRTELDALAKRAAMAAGGGGGDGGDAYELALIACAFHLAQRPETGAVRQLLAALQQNDGSLRGKTSITNSGGDDLAVETTGFAVLAWLPDAAFAGQVRAALEYVQRQRSARGTFGATQATIAALRALTAYAASARTMRTPGTLRVFAGERQVAERTFSAEDHTALTLELWDRLPPGEHALRLEVDGGGGPLPWACDVAWHAQQPADDPDGAVAVSAALRAGTVAEGGTVALDVAVTNRTEAELPTPIAIVGLPAGCELPTRVLEDLQRAGAFAFWELRGRELVLYWRTLQPRAEQKVTLDLVARVPGESTGPASRGYLYYTPAQKRWAAPLQLAITAK
jgi:hypothetical protein